MQEVSNKNNECINSQLLLAPLLYMFCKYVTWESGKKLFVSLSVSLKNP